MLYVITDNHAGIPLLLLSLCCLGTWPAMMELCARRGRHLIHTYLDYSLSMMFCACLAALTLGTFGEGDRLHPKFTVQLRQPNGPLVLAALVGGFTLMLGNLCMQHALVMGVPLALVLPLQASLTVSLGTSINYLLSPEWNDPVYLFLGVGAFLLAIALTALLHSQHSASSESTGNPQDEQTPLRKDVEKEEPGDTFAAKWKGVAVAFMGGISFGIFTPCLNIAVNDEFKWLPSGVPPLTVWTANFYFFTSFAVTAWISNIAMLYFPLSSNTRASSFWDYLNDHDHRWLAIATGALCQIGNALQFVGGSVSGFAAADLVQAFPLVGMAWGMFLFDEFRGVDGYVICLLCALYVSYFAGIVLMAVSIRS